MHLTQVIAAFGLGLSATAIGSNILHQSRSKATSATCIFTVNGSVEDRSSRFDVDFFGVTSDEPDFQNCQLGFLDNLRGQCGFVENWGCDNSNGVFKTSGNVFEGKDCVENAIFLSQNGLEGVTCQKV